MPAPKSLQVANGLWHGKSKLNLPWLAPEKRVSESESGLHVDTDGQNAFATITYHWAYEGKRQEGTLLVCKAHKSAALEMGWVDSWHQDGSVLHLKGEEAANGAVKAKGSYSAGKETWGWTIALALDHDQLVLTMENIMPSGEAVWAVKATYMRG